MDIREEDVTKYIDIVKSRLGKEIGRAKALDELTKLCRLMAVITRPIPKECYQATERIHREDNNSV